MIKIDTSWFIRKILTDRTEAYKDVIGYYTIIVALLIIFLVLILPLPIEEIKIGKKIISIMFIVSLFGYLIIFPIANKVDFIVKHKLRKTLIYDLKNLAVILKYPANSLLKEPETNDELHEYYAWRDGGEYRNVQKLWEISSNIAHGNNEKFVSTMSGMEKFIDSEIWVHENGKEWAVKFKQEEGNTPNEFIDDMQKKGRTIVNFNSIRMFPKIDENKCKIFDGGITDLLQKRWKEIIIYKIENNPFNKIAKRFEKPIKHIDIWNCVKFINGSDFFKRIK